MPLRAWGKEEGKAKENIRNISKPSENNLVVFILEKWKDNMERVKVTGKKSKRIMERYVDHKGVIWIRLKYLDKARTEVVMSEDEFNRIYGRFD